MRSPIIGKAEPKKKKSNLRIGIISIVIVFIAVGIGEYIWKQENRQKVLDIYVFNMKSGDAILV